LFLASSANSFLIFSISAPFLPIIIPGRAECIIVLTLFEALSISILAIPA
jgi:hypothetical protein